MTAVLAKAWNESPVGILSSDFRNEVDEYKEEEEVKEGEDGVVGGGGEVAVDWEACVLTECSTSNRKLFDLARKVRTHERLCGISLSPKECQEVFIKWESASKLYLRSRHDYFTEFLAKLESVKIPEGETLETAFQKSQDVAPPEQLKNYPNDAVQHFGSFCRLLHQKSGGNAIMLAQYPIAKLFKCTPHTISNWIRVLKYFGLLKLETKGSKGKSASTYFYLE